MPIVPPQIEPQLDSPVKAEAPAEQAKPGAPLSFVPHDAGAVPVPVRIRTNRYGELEEHELIRLLDTIEDERARGRFRESIYISVFVWIAIAWVVFYGPRYLWHAPRLISPVEVMKERALVELNAPVLPHPRVATPPKVDVKTLEHLRATERKFVPTAPAAAPEPAPEAPQPLPVNAAPSLPLPSAPEPVVARPQPPVADAPMPQPTSRPNFSTPGTASDDMHNAVRDAARSHSGGSGDSISSVHTAKGASAGGGMEILSDTQGVDFSQWSRHFDSDVMRNWIPLLPEETEPPLSKKGDTILLVKIMKDGSLGDLHLEGSTHDAAIDKAAWNSITSEGRFEVLPKPFTGPFIIIRLHYSVNGDAR
jgi:hypothetical protein